MDKGRWMALVAAVGIALSPVSCTASGGKAGQQKAEMGGTYKCSCGVEKTVKPGAPVPECCGKPMTKKQ